MPEHILPADIERTSLAIIKEELAGRGFVLTPPDDVVVCRVIHATADFDFAETLRFTPGAVEAGAAALKQGGVIVTDTNMAKAGVSRFGLKRLGGEVHCFMAEPLIADAAKKNGTTRAVAAVDYAAGRFPEAVFAVGNAPTALFRLAELIEAGYRPALVIGVPVGFVNVVESKKRLFEVCEAQGVPAIAAMGRKGGSTVAAAVCNALLYTAAGLLDPSARGWQ